MAYGVEWSPRAADDLDAIALYIATDSVAYASTVVRTILALSRNLSRFPFAGRVVPELADDNIRERFAYSYRVIYRIRDDVVTIAAIVHGKQQLKWE